METAQNEKLSPADFAAAVERLAKSMMLAVQRDAKRPIRTARGDRGCMLIAAGNGCPATEIEYQPDTQTYYLHSGQYAARVTVAGKAAVVRAALVAHLAALNSDALAA